MNLYFARRFILLTIFPLKNPLFFILFFTSCCIPPPTNENPTPLYELIPCHKSCIRKDNFGDWTMWALFGNDDDGIYGEGPHARFRPTQPNDTGKFALWWLRNPLHNFTFYVIGTADCHNEPFTLLKLSDRGYAFFTKEPRKPTEYSFDYGGIYIALHGWKPFISMRIPWSCKRGFACYFGWRCRGNFGIACNPAKEIRFADN